MRKLALIFPAVVLLLLFSPPTGLFAQNQAGNVSGTVTSETNNEPLEGGTVVNQRTKKTAITSKVGFFSIQAVKGDVLEFTFVGYDKKQFTVENTAAITIKMTPSTSGLQDVVITAYGINRAKKSLGYSTPTVAGEDVSNTQRESFVAGLAGRVPGLSINSTSGAPGASSQIILRGVVSLGGDNQALIVIDGLPIDNSMFNQNAMVNVGTNRNQDYSNRSIDINPADIESYTILKGPEATALYGNLGASGAIVITTRKAKSGRGAVSYNNSFRWETQTKFPEVQQVYSQGVSNGIYAGNTRNFFGPRYAAGSPIFDNVHSFFRTGTAQKHNLVMEGGTQGFSYRWSNEFSDNMGTIPGTRLTRISSRITAVAQISPILSATSTFTYMNTSNLKANKGDRGYLMALLTFPSRYDVKYWQDASGNRVLNTSDIYGETDNPFWDVYKNLNEDKTNRLLANTSLTLKPVKWLSINGIFGADISTTNGISVYHAQSYRGSGSAGTPTGGTIDLYQSVTKVLNGSLVATATHKAGDYSGTYLIGGNFSDNNYNITSQRGQNMYDPNFYSINNTLPTTQRNKLTVNRFRNMGVFGQAVMGYKSILYLTMTARMDGASRLMPNNPYFFYPATSLAFNFADLGFMKKYSWITLGKLRASLGYTGKEPRSYYITRTQLVPTGSTGGGFTYDLANGGNDKLKPERTRNIEAGLEMKFLNNRLGFDFTAYNLHSFDQIINPRLSYGSGFVIKTMNGGEVINKGLEIQLTGTPIKTKDFNWDVIVNYTQNRGTVDKISEDLPEFYDSDTWLQNGVRASVYPGSSTGAMGGWVNERNNKGDLLISLTTGQPILKNSTDFYDIGDRTPDFLMGFVNKFTYRNFSLSFLIDLRKGGDVYNATDYTLYTTGLSMKTLDREVPRVVKGVLKDGLENTANPTINYISIIPYNSSSYYTSTTNGVAPEQFVEHNINALRLRDVTLSYNLSRDALKRIKWIQDLGVFVTVTDAFLLSNYSGIDPDSNGTTPATGGLGGYGIDIGNMGRPLGFNVGMRVKF
ncbi:SusC/RagA family TonB-linked outer membrane protein [Sediminibacterium roseum]|uniref:SusC/RagA family TonB-linked outer membrane protein n=1 Tax=Sediminibacterium roseum TaxID=1978412 RepID=A0ABW9ZWM5_9BACT|nr:SusC/RagA family TonB-linked outer membrane protein [Sediminibacterium roseum]NCI50443.1 SusC/RagA family TonB-linked outer membrane protein [Sediminibacterium roseum]